MHSSILLTLLLHCLFSTPAFGQYYTSTAATATSSLTPAEISSAAASAASVSSVFASLATATPQQGSDEGGSPGDADSSPGGGTAAGASGTDTSSFNLSKGGLIAIIIVVTIVCVFGIVSTVLFYLAKKRSWEVRATIRRSARRVATALTPRRSEFPSSVKQGRRSSKNMSRLDEVPPTPKIKGFDLEKGNVKTKTSETKEPPKQSSKWGRKTDR